MTRRSAKVLLVTLGGLGILAFVLWLAFGRPPAETSAVEHIASQESLAESDTATLYFPGRGTRLRSEMRQLPAETQAEERVRRVVEALLAGPETEGLLAPLPAGIEVGSVLLAIDGTLFVDLVTASGPASLAWGSKQELLTVYSLVNSVLSNEPQARRVMLLWNGQQRPTFAGHVDVTRPLTLHSGLIGFPAGGHRRAGRWRELRPIGVFDSGVGGLTVVAALRRHLPSEPILYLGDTARLPYGTKSAETVVRYTRRNLDFLVARGVKAAVVACNTASALALPLIEEPVPLWGVIEPGAREAARVSRGRVGVLATESTVRSAAYERALHAARPELEAISQACPLFVPLVEEGWEADPVTRQIARRYLEPLLEKGVDTLILGCTHYPLLAPTLSEIAGEEVELVSSAEAAAREVASALESRGLRESAGGSDSVHLCMTDNAERFERMAQRILGGLAAKPEHVDV